MSKYLYGMKYWYTVYVVRTDRGATHTGLDNETAAIERAEQLAERGSGSTVLCLRQRPWGFRTQEVARYVIRWADMDDRVRLWCPHPGHKNNVELLWMSKGMESTCVGTVILPAASAEERLSTDDPNRHHAVLFCADGHRYSARLEHLRRRRPVRGGTR